MAASSQARTDVHDNLAKSFKSMEVSDDKAVISDLSDITLPLEPLYKLCLKYYKDNVGKASAISYQDRNNLLALHKQVTCGKYKPDGGNEPGFLDVVGNDRKAAWQALGDMSKEEAQKDFIRLLNKCSPSLKPYIIAYKVQQEEEEKKRKQAEEEQKRQAEREEAEKQAAASQRMTLQEQQVRQALNQQTEAQFRAYAQTQFPGDSMQQDALIRQLQEQHFQQYVRQVYEQQMKSQQQQQQPTAAASALPNQASALPSSVAATPQQLLQNQTSSQGHLSPSGALPQGSAALSQPTHNEQINGHDVSDLPDSIVIQEASMWTQKDTIAFKNAIKKESKMENHSDCIIKVGSGETVTIRVPTHENGNCLFWEFATDYYDLAFGVYFEWTTATDDNVQVRISDSSDEEDEEASAEDGKSDPERGGESASKAQGPPIDEIIPIYRRDCHEEVYCGSHVYPGRGVYLLKFDNSYSLWRSKTLYYRVYYSR